ncbi:MAG TPA: HipA domain-containing protein [Candidatus Limnocylindria bacterium]|nr:HipA domain-containing protein [Candidatus Limnocylindria bacterium]
MSATTRDEAVVVIDTWPGSPRRAGWLRRAGVGDRSDIAFEYDRDWLAMPGSFSLDPTLELREGEQRRRAAAQLPPVFTDAAPDRWGRKLLEQRETEVARREGRKPHVLDPFDFLVRVNDATRLGAIRLQHPGDGRFLDDSHVGVPPKAELRELEAAADRLERGAKASENERAAWLEKLLAPGASLGGARPKASFENADGSLWMAKFPAPSDTRDKGSWEYVLGALAKEAGVIMPDHGLMALGSAHHTVTARRFDREGSNRRMYASAMTLLDVGDHSDGASYVDIAAVIEVHGTPRSASIEEDLAQLFRRAVFNAVTGHRDDHLRNHGFLHDGKGWRLAPAFDLNPMPEMTAHELAFDDRGTRAPDLEVIAATARQYRLKAPQAAQIIHEVNGAVSRWRQEATRVGIARHEQERVANAFSV